LRPAERPGRFTGYTRRVGSEDTESIVSEGHGPSGVDWILVVALDCQALTSSPERFNLIGIDQVLIGRGTERTFSRADSQARLDLPDRWISQNHARLVRIGDCWWIEDECSRNGTRKNGLRVTREALGDADIIECGGTFLVMRRGDEAKGQAEALGDRPEALRTLSPTLDHELEVLRKVAQSRVPVLVLGQTGTGKEGTARVIHELSGRQGPLVAVNCGAIPATLIESELFGSRRGAFSGAEDRPGLVRGADGGTLFLDEVAELPPGSQAALLRVLQEKELLPLGARRAISVDVRVVAATNRQVADLVEEGTLRRDLYARLSGYELHLPPLCERLEDLGLLISTLVARHDTTGGPRTLSRTAAWALFAYPWPFNIRELEQCLSAAVAVAGPEIGIEHLPKTIRDGESSPRHPAASERDHILALIDSHGGNLSAVARALKTSRSQLYRLLVRHEIQPDVLKRPPAKPAG
jgi:transcriptional regulator of acetoin/glycerol metabolism